MKDATGVVKRVTTLSVRETAPVREAAPVRKAAPVREGREGDVAVHDLVAVREGAAVRKVVAGGATGSATTVLILEKRGEDGGRQMPRSLYLMQTFYIIVVLITVKN